MKSQLCSRSILRWLTVALLSALLVFGILLDAGAQEANTAEAAAAGEGEEQAQAEQPAEENAAATEESDEVVEGAPAEAEEAATNVADNSSAEAAEETQPLPAEPGVQVTAPAPMETTVAPSELPSVAEGQPGFIPDRGPQDLMEETPSGFSSGELAELFGLPEEAEGEPFPSNLGESKLPADPSIDIITRQERSPEEDLPPNHARLVVPPGGIIRGSTETKQFHIEGGITLYYSDITILGEVADIDEKNEIAVLRGGVNILDPEYSMKTDELRIYFEDKRFEAVGFVQFEKFADPAKAEPDQTLDKKDRLREYFAGKSFELYCSKLYYDWESLSLTALDSVRIKHPVFNGSMDRLDYNDETKEYEMSGSPVLEVTNYDWIFETQLAEEDDEQTVQALTDGNTKITCDRLVYTEDSGVAQFYALPGNEVSFVQPTRNINANYIEVNDQTKDFYAEGNGSLVRYEQSEGEWLFAGGLVDREQVSEDLTSSLEGALEVQAENLTYNFDRKRLALFGQVSVSAGEKLIKANEMVQDEQAQFFLLRGNVLLKPDKDSQVLAAQVFIDTDKDIITLVGLVDGELRSEDLVIEQLEGEELTGDQQVEVAEGVFGASSTGQGTTNVAEGT